MFSLCRAPLARAGASAAAAAAAAALGPYVAEASRTTLVMMNLLATAMLPAFVNMMVIDPQAWVKTTLLRFDTGELVEFGAAPNAARANTAQQACRGARRRIPPPPPPPPAPPSPFPERVRRAQRTCPPPRSWRRGA